MDDTTELRGAVDRVLVGDLEPLLGLLDEDVVFQVVGGDESPGGLEETGKQAVEDYFTTFCGIVAFWQMDYTVRGDQLIVWGRENFTIERCGLEGASEFAIVFDLTDGLITRLQMIEDLPAYLRDGDSSLLADSLPLEVEMHPVTRGDDAGQLPVLSTERVQLALGGESLGPEVTDYLPVLPPGFDRHPRRCHGPAWLRWPGGKWYLESC
jgi:ketosteroid isomerase-like protein